MEPLLQIEKIDVYSPNGNGPINYWVQEIIEGRMPELDKEIHYWVHVRDVERAVETLQTNNIAGVFSVSGRRAWNKKKVLDES